ncbi:thrombospondin-1-like [Mytilus trossulus]|uniref:thrombospondin-1-like n=1 Tax=Mytilus trossulus TaxID=6551 RepID=UPI003004355E
MREIILLLYLLTDQIAFSEATITTTWYDWGACIQIYGSLDQNCRGTQTRTGIKEDSEADTYTHISQSQGCYLTYDKIDGGYTTWSEWDDCSHKCNQRTNRRRTCHNPTPCNGGEDCSQFGRDTLTKDCVKDNFTGYYTSCEAPGKRAVLLSLGVVSSSVLKCATMCSQINSCAVFNYQNQDKRCELLSVGTDPLTEVPKSVAVGWQYYAKCYDENEACFGCCF